MNTPNTCRAPCSFSGTVLGFAVIGVGNLEPGRPAAETVAQYAEEQKADCNHTAIMFRFASDRESNGQDVFGSDSRIVADGKDDRETHAGWNFAAKQVRRRERPCRPAAENEYETASS